MVTEQDIQQQAYRRLNIQHPEEISSIVQELQSQRNRAKDYLVPAHDLSVDWRPDAPATDDAPIKYSPRLFVPSPMTSFGNIYPVAYKLSGIAHEQLADRTGIPMAYYRRLMSAWQHQRLYSNNVNHWLVEKADEKLLIRTLDDHVRAILSDHYRRLNDFDLAIHTTKVAQSTPGALVQRVDITEERFYMRILHAGFAERLERQADGTRALEQKGLFGGITDTQGGVAHSVETSRTVLDSDMRGERNEAFKQFQALATHPDMIVPVVIVSNSEVGRGGLNIDAGIYQTYCYNTAIFTRAMGRIHRGSKLDDLLSDNTRNKQDELFWAEVEDVIRNTFDQEKFRQFVEKFLGLQSDELKDPAKAVEQLAAHKDVTMSDQEQQAILNGLITQGQGATAWGLVNAVTAFAHQPGVQADRRIELETLGGKLIENFPRELVVVRN